MSVPRYVARRKRNAACRDRLQAKVGIEPAYTALPAAASPAKLETYHHLLPERADEPGPPTMPPITTKHKSMRNMEPHFRKPENTVLKVRQLSRVMTGKRGSRMARPAPARPSHARVENRRIMVPSYLARAETQQ